MFKILVIIIVIGFASFIFTDTNSDSIIISTGLPILVFLSFVSLAIWFVLFFYKHRVDQKSGGDGYFSIGGGDDD